MNQLAIFLNFFICQSDSLPRLAVSSGGISNSFFSFNYSSGGLKPSDEFLLSGMFGIIILMANLYTALPGLIDGLVNLKNILVRSNPPMFESKVPMFYSIFALFFFKALSLGVMARRLGNKENISYICT